MYRASPQKLHNFSASTRHLRPPRLPVGILLKAANVFPVELKIYLAKPSPCRPFYQPRMVVYDNNSKVIQHYLPPNGKQRLFECSGHDSRVRP